MRSSLGVLLAVLISPLAQAELLDEVNDRGELRIAVQAEHAPYVFKDGEHLNGFDVEFGQALAGELDLRATFLEAPTDGLLEGVESGLYDIALDEQPLPATAAVDSSQPYGAAARVIPFQKDNPAFESAVNNALQRLDKSGRLGELETKWLKPGAMAAEAANASKAPTASSEAAQTPASPAASSEAAQTPETPTTSSEAAKAPETPAAAAPSTDAEPR